MLGSLTNRQFAVSELITKGKVRAEMAFLCSPKDRAGKSPVAESWLRFPFGEREERRRRGQTDGRWGEASERGSETVFLSLGGVAALFHQP